MIASPCAHDRRQRPQAKAGPGYKLAHRVRTGDVHAAAPGADAPEQAVRRRKDLARVHAKIVRPQLRSQSEFTFHEDLSHCLQRRAWRDREEKIAPHRLGQVGDDAGIEPGAIPARRGGQTLTHVARIASVVQD